MLAYLHYIETMVLAYNTAATLLKKSTQYIISARYS